jgi:transposase
VDRDGLSGLMPAKPGPRRAHKLTDEVVTYAQQLREQDPTVGSARLAAAIAESFAITVHPRSVERALVRLANPKSGGGQ